MERQVFASDIERACQVEQGKRIVRATVVSEKKNIEAEVRKVIADTLGTTNVQEKLLNEVREVIDERVQHMQDLYDAKVKEVEELKQLVPTDDRIKEMQTKMDILFDSFSELTRTVMDFFKPKKKGKKKK